MAEEQTILNEPVTVIFFSCRRLHLLQRTVDAFLQHNTYPITEYIVVNDSADPIIHDEIRKSYPNFTVVLNKENVGLFKSIDLGYQHVKTNYHFLCEDDWMITKGGFIEKSLAIMQGCPNIEEVWLDDYSKHPLEKTIHETNGVKYVLAQDDYYYEAGFIYGWHGFTTSCALKRIEDYRKVGSYGEIVDKWLSDKSHNPSIWHREHAIGQEYRKLGYRTAVLIDAVYAKNIGFGQSEYKSGGEK